MKNYLILILSIAVIILAILLVTNPKIPEVKTVTTTKVIPGDTVPRWDTLRVPSPYYVYSDPEIITLPPDSMLMLEYLKLRDAYTQIKIYKDTLINDSSLFAMIIDTISKNSLKKRVFGYENRKKTAIYTTINTTVLDNKGWYLGGNMGKNIQNVSIIYQYKNFLFSGGYEFQNKTPVIGCYFKL